MTPDTPTSAMVFAAGFGTRMGALTADRPKPLINVAGRALIDHTLDIVESAGITRKIVNVHYRAEMMRRHLAGRSVTISEETGDILETGGGLRKALPLLRPGPVYTLNSDSIWRGPNPLTALSDAWSPEIMDALLLLIAPEAAHGHSGAGDFVLGKDGQITRGPGLIYSGAQIIKTDRLADITDAAFSLNVVWDRMLSDGRVFGLRYPGAWCDVGTPHGIQDAENLLRGDRDV
ncbi:nucleotidyltransferase family protein [Aliiroseovarius sp. YM-037]|uniref:nucleotidyltransferase family protein n=1 Tax=Aliiroseovarius sp. YM-037 TaxID=3341728 RepID=UPI003A7F66A4